MFLCHYPSDHSASRLASALPCGVRTFLDRLPATADAWPTPSPILAQFDSPLCCRTHSTRFALAPNVKSVTAAGDGGAQPPPP